MPTHRTLAAATIACLALGVLGCSGENAADEPGGIITAAVHTRTSTPAATATATAPARTVTVAVSPSGAVEAAPTAQPGIDATTAPATAPQPTRTPAPVSPANTSVTVRAFNLAFDTANIRVAPGARVTATLINDDATIEHNLTFGIPGLAHGDSCTGPCRRTQTFTAPATAGSFFFLCTIHDMFGTFVVE